jgi:hypothetical protein
MDPPIPANDLQAESVLLDVPYIVLIGDDWRDMVAPGGSGGSGGTRAWAAVAG